MRFRVVPDAGHRQARVCTEVAGHKGYAILFDEASAYNARPPVPDTEAAAPPRMKRTRPEAEAGSKPSKPKADPGG